MNDVAAWTIRPGDEHAAAALWEAVGYRRQANRSRFVRMLDEN